MSVLSVSERSGARSSLNEKGEREYTRYLRAVTSSPLVSGLTVLESNGIPAIGDIYVGTDGAFDAQSICKKVEPQQDSENPILWDVTVDYGAPSADQDQQNPNPLLRPAVITWGFTKFQRPVWRDINNKAILNSARMYFDPPPEMDDSRPVLSITRNEPIFNPSIAVTFQDAINSDNCFGFSPGQSKVAGISAQSQTENNYFFWQVSYEFEFRRDGWQLQILDQGRYAYWKIPIYQKDAAGNVVQVQVSDPVPLDGNGAELANPTPDNSKFLPFDIYKQLAFSQLALP